MLRITNNCGFTLIELLVVIAIIAILSAALMPAISSSLDGSRVTQCRSNLTHVAIALRMYYNDQGDYPPSLSALLDAGFITDDSLLRCTSHSAASCLSGFSSRKSSNTALALKAAVYVFRLVMLPRGPHFCCPVFGVHYTLRNPAIKRADYR